MNKEILGVLLVSIIVLISGCTMPFGGGGEKQTTMAGTQGLTILYFGPDVEYPVSGQSINLEARIKNVGDAVAKNVEGEIYLLSWGSTSIAKGADLNPPDPEVGREGEEDRLTWRVKAPNVTKTQTYDAGVHVRYDYTTTTVATIYAFSRTEYRKRMERREPIPKVKNIVNSNSPVHVDVRIQNILKTGSTDVPITLVFKNVGGGNVEYNAHTKHYIIKRATVKIGDTTKECSNITMKGGREGYCTVRVDVPSTSDEVKLPIEITTSYQYEISAETKISVHPEFE